MKTALQIDLSFDQILSIVSQLPKKQKLRLTKELEKEVIESKLSQLLKSFKSDKLDLDTIAEEADIIRKEIYEKQNARVILDTHFIILKNIGF